MKLNFKYDLEKDIENFIKSSNSKNNPDPTLIMKEYIQKYGNNFTEENLRLFILDRTKDIDMDYKLQEMKDSWSDIEDEFILIADRIFGIHIPFEKIVVYISLNSRCTYNIKENYFFTSIPRSDESNNIIMHELLHFYTWEAFGKTMIANKYNTLKYNDIKESLTVLLNIEFKNLMKDKTDKGYLQHQDMREKISILWKNGTPIKEIIEQLK